MFIIVFLLTILILVLIHEFGHYFVAKKFNIKVLEFGFGLPPKFWGKKIGETIYSLNWLPFGGFVRLLGEDEVDKKLLENERSSSEWKNRSFATQKIWKRIVVVVAGVTMNLLLAWVLFYIVLISQNFKTWFPLIVPYEFVGVSQKKEEIILISDVSANSPAQKTGLKSEDRILEFNSKTLRNSDEFVNLTKENLGKEITLTISDVQKQDVKKVKLTPRKDPPKGQGALGVSLIAPTVVNLEYEKPWQKALAGPIHGYNLTVYSGLILGKTISVAWEKQDLKPVSQNIAGPIGITSLVKEILTIKNPLIPYLNFMAALSLNLAIVNVLPFPGLDGGRLFFLIVEAITRKRTHPVLEKYVHTVGLVILLGLIFLITISDIRKLIF